MEENYLIEKWLNDTLTADEKEAFERMEDAKAYKEIMQEAQRFSASGQLNPASLKSIETRIAMKAAPKRLSFKRYYKGVAAAAILVFGLLWIWKQTPMVSYETAVGEQLSIRLPDASEVTLNAGSQLVYDQDVWKDERRLELKGEAFFEVAKGATFSVHTPQGIVKVIGTAFNVKDRSGWFEVTCFEGVVQVVTANRVEELYPGAVFRSIGNEIHLEENQQKIPSWTHDISSFNKVPVEEVFDEMERQFGVRISLEISNPKALFSGAFEHENVDIALREITKPLNLTYSFITKETVNIHDKTE
jgi:ferric-dicitrate binding protein FerR (iron transport regulator)